MNELGTLRVIGLVTRRELRQRVRSRTFRVGTLVIAALATALALLPTLTGDTNQEEWTVAVSGSAPPSLERAVDAAAASQSATVALRRSGGDPDALARQDDIDAVIVDGRTIVAAHGTADGVVAALRGAVARSRVTQELAEAGVDPGAVSAARDVGVERVGPDEDETWLATMLGVVALFFAIATYGAWVLNSVLEEKTNRVVEIVVATIAPRELLAGKVIGNGLAGLAQFTIVVGLGGGVAVATGAVGDLPGGGPLVIASVVVAFVLGFAFYAVGYAAAGSLVSRQEDAQSAVAPMMTVVLTAYFLSLFVVNPDPGSTAARIISLVPPVTPMAMPARIAAGEVAAWEVALAVALMLAATWLMVRLAARVYTSALLRTGGRVPAREALRAAWSRT
jgi:ABC-2 type transport system permease protein